MRTGAHLLRRPRTAQARRIAQHVLPVARAFKKGQIVRRKVRRGGLGQYTVNARLSRQRDMRPEGAGIAGEALRLQRVAQRIVHGFKRRAGVDTAIEDCAAALFSV